MSKIGPVLPFVVVILLMEGLSMTQTTDTAKAIGTVLDGQVKAWNRGDLRGYMAGYWNSPELIFFSGGAVTQGWQSTLDRYQKRYQGDGNEMGVLCFEELSIQPLGDNDALVRGHWHLRLSGGKEPKGLFTLIFRRFPNGWYIIHDHTSSE